MQKGIVALGALIFLSGIVLAAYSKTVGVNYYCGGLPVNCFPRDFLTVYPYQQLGLAILLLGVVCIAIGAYMNEESSQGNRSDLDPVWREGAEVDIYYSFRIMKL